MQEASWFIDLFRSLMALLDSIIYGFIDYAYKMIVYLSRLVILDSEQIVDITDRIYLILGIVMLFKVAFSLVNYMASPDDFTSGEKGIANIVKRIIISLIMLTFVGNVFNLAYRFQAIILEDNIIPNFVLGAPDDEADNSIATAGQDISFQIFTGFFQLNPITSDYTSCLTLENGTVDCQNEDGGLSDLDVYKLELAYNNKDISYLLSMVNVSVSSDGEDNGTFTGWISDGFYAFNYSVLISTIVGVIVLLVFISFVFDVVTRLAKLTFLQLVAPIPIISYVDPKGGDKIFKSWIKEVTSTYLSLFIKLTIVFFAIYLCTQVSEFGISFFDANTGQAIPITNGGFQHGLAVALVIIGILLFAKEAPKLLESLFGIKGSFSLNPMKKLREIPGLSYAGAQIGARTSGGARALSIAMKDRNLTVGDKIRQTMVGQKVGAQAIKDKVKFMSGSEGKKVGFLNDSQKAVHKHITGEEGKDVGLISTTRNTIRKARTLAGMPSGKQDEIERAKRDVKIFREAEAALRNAVNDNNYDMRSPDENIRANARKKWEKLSEQQRKIETDREILVKKLKRLQSDYGINDVEISKYLNAENIIADAKDKTGLKKADDPITHDYDTNLDTVDELQRSYGHTPLPKKDPNRDN